MATHELSKAKLGVICSCGRKFPVIKAGEQHVAEETEREANEAKHAGELEAAKTTEAKVDTETGEMDAPEVEEPRQPEQPKATPAPHHPSGLAVPEQNGALRPGDIPLDLANMTLNQINFIGKTMAASGMFPDAKDAAVALTKILAGQEIGVTPFQALTNIHIIQGKATMAANLMAAKVKGSGKYDYRVKVQTAEECSIDFYEIIGNKREFIGNSSFTLAEAKAAGVQNLQKFPRNMLFARAISNGAKWYTPDVFNGNLVYLPEELGAPVNEDGEVVQGA